MPKTSLPFTFTSIDPSGSTFTFPFGINPQGDIVGNYTAASGVNDDMGPAILPAFVSRWHGRKPHY